MMDESNQTALKNLLRQWSDERQESLREQVMLAWKAGQERLAPDDALVDLILAGLAPAGDTDADLGAALDPLGAANTQGEVLKRLLDGALRFGQRGALFVIKQGIASLYAHRFDAEQPRLGVPVVPPPALEDLIQGRVGPIATPGPAYQALLVPLSRTGAADCRILPLHLRRRTVALVLVDSGREPRLGHPNHLRALVLAAEARLAYLASVKEEERNAAPEAQPSILTQRIPETIAETAAPVLDPAVRINAERSARVLVSDLELYFPAKVSQARQAGNLYASMKDELDRSRASFVERYGADLESQHHIFYKTVVQQLCAGDPSSLGAAPWAAH